MVPNTPSSWKTGHFGMAASGSCGEVEDGPHFCLFYPRVVDLCEALYVRLLSLVLGLPRGLGAAHVGLPLNGPPDRAAHVGPFGCVRGKVWESWHNLRPLSRGELAALEN
jgi:hypothetical protein